MAYDWDGRITEAIEACERAVELNPDYPEAHAYLAEAYTDADRWGEAAEAGRRAIELDPQSVDARRDYGYALEEMGYWNAAIEQYQAALDIHPNLPHLYIDLGRNYLYLANTSQAIHAFEQAVALDPDRAEALDRLGWTYYAIEDYAQAQSYLEQAIEADPDFATAYGHLAQTFWVRRNYESAIANFETAISLAYRASRRDAQAFFVSIEWTEDVGDYPSADTVLRGEFEWDDAERTRLVATLVPETETGRWTEASGEVALDVVTGQYTLVLEGMPDLPLNQVYVGWFEGLQTLDELPFKTGPMRVGSDGALNRQLTAEPVSGPRIGYFYTLGLSYYYMDRCEQAFPVLENALQMDPENEAALEAARLCREAEAGNP
jgi:tetratricopeptide (TPR) repeat protein